MATALFVTTTDIAKFTSLNGNLDPDKFTDKMKVAQDIHIQSILGTDLFNKINNDIVASTLAAPYTTLLTSYIKPMVIHYTMVEYLPFASYTIGNKGVYKHGSENGETISKEEMDSLIEKERSLAQHYTQRFVDYICFNSSSFPEYNSNSNGDMFPDRDVNLGGWFL
jgi:hypothetical protein